MFKVMTNGNGFMYTLRIFADENAACRYAVGRCVIIGNVFVVDKQGRVIHVFCGRDAVFTGI